MERHLDPKALRHLADYQHSRYFVVLAPGNSYEDLFSPVYWAHHRLKLKQYDIVRVRAHDGAFDVDLTVAGTPKGGVLMEYRSGRPPKALMSTSEAKAHDASEAIRIQVVPIGRDGKPVVRTDWQKATNWRVIGLNSEEVARDLVTEGEAIAIRDKYLTDLMMRLPTEEEIAAAKAEQKKSAKARAAA